MGRDTLHRRNLKEVVVNGRQQQIARAAMPEQIKTEKDISTLNASCVADVAKHFSGVTVKDYGGIGGFKTVSLRGLGAQHTGVCYDGLMLSDIQSGEVDLGRFSINNISEISLNNGQPNDIFQSARMFASAGVLNFKTKLPDNNGNQALKGKATVKSGSFGLVDAGVFLMQNRGKKWAYNFSADGQVANGKYKFIQKLGSTNNVLSDTLIRKNSDIQSFRSEINVQRRLREKESLTIKANYFLSERGLPGPVVYYNSNPSKARLWDRVFFTQLHYESRISDKLQYQWFARFNNVYNRYRDLSSNYPSGILEESFLQNEYYLSSCLRYTPVAQLQLSASTDWWYNDLQLERSTNYETFPYPTRHNGLANLAAKYVTERFTLSGNVLYTMTREKVITGTASPNQNKLSPTASLSYKLLENKELRIRTFYKNIFRVPSFNELYYRSMGNHNLRPEKANQFNIGFTYLENNIPFLSELGCSIDAFHNEVTDKIVAIPTDLFHWSMSNKGSVNINGLDANLRMAFQLKRTDKLNIAVNYSYQKATDVTPGSANYGDQIPYTPFHSGSASASYRHKIWEGGYNLIFSGKCWKGQNSDINNKIDGYMEHSVFATAYYKNWKLMGEIINLLNTHYEILKFYPMPRRNFRITLSKSF